ARATRSGRRARRSRSRRIARARRRRTRGAVGALVATLEQWVTGQLRIAPASPGHCNGRAWVQNAWVFGGIHMHRTTIVSSAGALLALISLAGCEPAPPAASTAAAPPAATASAAPQARNSYQDWPTGGYRVVENWPKPLPDTRHSHEGWTWGSFGGVYAESPDRVWIAMRGELPLPAGAAPWTPYVALNPSRGNATGNGDGITATCGDEPKRGWERRFEHSIFIVNRNGELVDEWPHLDPMFSQLPCGRGPHQVKISP